MGSLQSLVEWRLSCNSFASFCAHSTKKATPQGRSGVLLIENGTYIQTWDRAYPVRVDCRDNILIE